MGAMTVSVCQTHLERAGVAIPAEHVVDGQGFCHRCFAGISPTQTKPRRTPGRAQPNNSPRAVRDQLQPRVLAAIAKVFEARAEMFSRDENSELRGFEEWISAAELAREVGKRDNWPWKFTTTRLRWILSPLGIRPQSRRLPGIFGPHTSIYRRDSFAQLAPSAAQDFEPLRTDQDVENEVRELARAGFNNKAIAGKLEIPPRAVKRILFVLYRETNVENADPVSRRYKLVARLNGAAGAFLERAAQSAAD